MNEPIMNTPNTEDASPTPNANSESPFVIHRQPMQNQILVHALPLAFNNTPTAPRHRTGNQQQNQGVRRQLEF